MSQGREIRLVQDEDGWTAIDEDSGLETSAETREEALEQLDEATSVSFDRDPDDEEPEALQDIDELDDMELFGG